MDDRIRTLYGVVTVDEGGGMTLDGYKDEDKARARAKEIIEDIKRKKIPIDVYLSELEYYVYRNTYVSNEFINDESKLLYSWETSEREE